MAQEQTVTGRIVIKYTVSGLQHRLVANVRNLQSVGATWVINSRTTDSNDMGWTDAANGLFEATSYLIATPATFADAELWRKVGNAWILTATHTGVFTDHQNGTLVTGSQHTMTLRDAQFHFLKVVIMESASDQLPHKYISVASMPTGVANFAKQWTPSATIAVPPYVWQVSDSQQYINPAGFVSLVKTFNRKLRRTRGLA